MKLEKRKMIRRIIISPLMFLINLLWAIVFSFERTIDFVRYGGEIITYEKGERKTIQDVYELVLNEIKKGDDEISYNS